MSTVRIIVQLDDGTGIEAEEYFATDNPRYFAPMIGTAVSKLDDKIHKSIVGMYGTVEKL